ncbi:MAG: alpha/beta hydrolase family protein [Planctomycetes bacterium]|nr:alpha/beta hydrolase family protein [Planctomycetota bacterium]
MWQRSVLKLGRWVAVAVVVWSSAARLPADEGPAKPVSAFTDVPAAGKVEFRPAALETSIPERFRLTGHEFDFQSQLAHGGEKFRMFRVTFPSPVKTAVEENNTVHAEYFQPAGTGPFPAAVVLHILGGDFVLAETVASHLARNGIAALFVKMPYYGPRRRPGVSNRMISEDPHETVQGMTQAVLDIRRAAAWLAARSEVDPERLGITGISLGGIMSALAASGEPRLKSVAVFLGGGNFADLIWSNDTRQAQEFRKRWVAAGGTPESFKEIVQQVDPVTYGKLLKGRRVLMIAARNDEVVPPASATALWESIDREPELVWIDAGHYTAIKFLPQELIRLDMFFNGKIVKPVEAK